MTLRDFNIYVYEKSLEENATIISQSWKTVNFVGLLLSGKLKDLEHYMPKREIKKQLKKLYPDKHTPYIESLVLKAIEQAKKLGHKVPDNF